MEVNDSHKAIYQAFVEFMATPKSLRDEDNQTIEQFLAVHTDVSRSTLFGWKREGKFWNDVKRVYDKLSGMRLNDVRNALVTKAMEGDTGAIKLFLQYEEKWNEKLEAKLTGTVNITDYLKSRKSLKEGKSDTTTE